MCGSLAALRGKPPTNRANRARGEDRDGRLAGVYNAAMGLRLSGDLRPARSVLFMKLPGLIGVKCWEIYIYLYTLSGWTGSLALQINIHRCLILPSVKRQRVTGIRGDRFEEIKGETLADGWWRLGSQRKSM